MNGCNFKLPTDKEKSRELERKIYNMYKNMNENDTISFLNFTQYATFKFIYRSR